MTALRVLLVAQGGYYTLTGLWPLISIETFELVTGPKTDRWLVYMVGLLAMTIGICLIAGTRYAKVRSDTLLLAFLAAFAFATIDVVFVLNGTIDSIYLADAGVEVAIIVLLLVFIQGRRLS